MKIAIHQPTYFPWNGLIDKIGKAEHLILLDDVQLSDSSFQHRTVLIDGNGNKKYLTIPFTRKNYRNLSIKDLKVADSSWSKRHASFISNNYRKHEYYDEIYPFLEKVFLCKSDYLLDIILISMISIIDLLKININLMFQSQQNYDRNKVKSDLILDLVKAVGATSYLSGIGAKAYLKEGDFQKLNIILLYNNYTPVKYKQKNSPIFIENLSILDMLFNIGFANVRNILIDSKLS